MNQALLMTVLMGFTHAGEVLQSANEMHSTSQTAQSGPCWLGGSGGSLPPDTIIHFRLPLLRSKELQQ